MSVPRLAQLRPGPGEHATTTSINQRSERRRYTACGGDGDASEDSTTEEPAFCLAGPSSHTPKKSAEPETTQGGTPDTQRHGATRKRNGSSRGALGACDGEHAGVEDPRRLTHRPRVLETGGGTMVEGSPGNSDVQEPAHGPKADDSSAREHEVPLAIQRPEPFSQRRQSPSDSVSAHPCRHKTPTSRKKMCRAPQRTHSANHARPPKEGAGNTNPQTTPVPTGAEQLRSTGRPRGGGHQVHTPGAHHDGRRQVGPDRVPLV